jgi:hypothetical protein
VLISTSTILADSMNMILEGIITSLNGKRLKYHQWTRLKVIDVNTGKAAPITDKELNDIRQTMAGGDIDHPDDYSGRVRAIIEALKA